MSRTWRNRHTVPHGWSVRDNGMPYLNGWDLYGNSIYYKTGVAVRIRKYRRPYYQCEQTQPRRQYNRLYRAKTNHLVRVGKFDDILPPCRTGGWASW